MLANRLAAPGARSTAWSGESMASYDRLSQPPQRPEAEMAKKSRKKKARRKNAANHGKRPNS
jgi:hypothetical protein